MGPSLNSMIKIVVFLVLTAIAAVLYGGSEEQKAKMEQNFFYQKARAISDTIIGVAGSLVAINLHKNTGPVVREVGDLSANALSSSLSSSDMGIGFWKKMANNIREEWDSGEKDFRIDYSGVREINPNDFFSWQKTENGIEIIYRAKSGEEYKLPLPFSFLNK